MRTHHLTCLVIAALLVAAVPALAAADDPAGTLERAQELFIAGQLAQADAKAREAIPGTTDAEILKGACDVVILCKLSAGDFDGARQAAQDLKAQIEADRPDNAAVEYLDSQVSDIEAKKAAYDQTIADLEAAVAAYPSDERGASAAYKIGVAKAAWGKRQEALAAYQRVVAEFGFSDRALAARLATGALYEQMLDTAGAEAQYQAVVNAQPDSPYAGQAVLRISLLHLLQDDVLGARERMEDIATAHPDTEAGAAAQYAQGDIYLAETKIEQAQGVYSQVAQEQHQTVAGGAAAVRAAANLMAEARALSDEALYDDAIAKYREVIELVPDSATAPQAQLLIGHNYIWQQDSVRAKEEYSKTVADYPDTPEAMEAVYYRGLCELDLGENAAAADDLLTTLDNCQNDHILHHATVHGATALMRLGRYPEARALCEQVLSRPEGDPWNDIKPWALLTLGQAHLREKSYDKARAAFDALRMRYPDSPQTEGLAVLEPALQRAGG